MNSRIDLPLQNYTEDEPLGLAPYARALGTFVKTCETPLTVGIQGDWGIGKTSLLNMVSDRLGTPTTNRDRRSFPTVYFNTWQYAQLDGEQHLTVALLGDLVREIGALGAAGSESRDRARGLLAKVGRMAASAASQVVQDKTGVDIAQTVRDGDGGDLDDVLPVALRLTRLVTEYKADFRELVAALLRGREPGSRLVVMIDDLDRIRPTRALELLSAVKNFLDVPGCVFLLAVDYEVIQRGVAEKMGAGERRRHGKSYFDKIIQVPFNMPVASYKVDRYVLALLGWTPKEGSKDYVKLTGAGDDLYFKNQRSVTAEAVSDIKNVTTLTVGQNPRAIKRAANYFALLKLVFDENGGQDLVTGGRQDLYLRLLYAMACFHLAYPELFTLFVQEPTPTQLRRFEDVDALAALPQMRFIAERVADPDETMSQIAGFFDQLVAIVDTDESGDISAAEFRPILDVLKRSRLTSATIQEAEDGFVAIKNRALHFAAHWKTPEKKVHLGRAVDAIKKSNWNDPLRLRIREAGARFYNLTWEGRLVGSVASSKKDPLQFYLKDPGGLMERLSDRSAPFVHDVGHGHYGVGSLRVKLWDLAKRDNAPAILGDVLAAANAPRAPSALRQDQQEVGRAGAIADPPPGTAAPGDSGT